jgi:hypothetical protein
MSALGQKRTWDCRSLMSALPPKADIARRELDVRFVPKADMLSTPMPSGSTCATRLASVGSLARCCRLASAREMLALCLPGVSALLARCSHF